MSILRVKRTKGYTTIPNSTLCDDRLSFRARGVLAFLLAKPDDWETRTTDLPDHGKEGRDAVRTAIKELRDLGYMDQEKEQYRDEESGKWLWRTVTIVRDFPEPENPSSESVPETDSQSSESSCYVATPKGGSEDGFSGAPLLPISITSSRDIEVLRTSGAHALHEDDKPKIGSRGWDAVRPVYRPKKKSKRQEAAERAQAELELDPAYMAAQVLDEEPPAAGPSGRLPASDDDLAPPVRRGRQPRSKSPAERLADYFAREAKRVGHNVPGSTNKAALARNLRAWMSGDTEYQTVVAMIDTYWSESWQRSDNTEAWKDFQNQRGALTQRLGKQAKVEQAEANRYNEDAW